MLRQQNGYIALIAVLIISAVALAIGLSLNIFGIQESQTSLMTQYSAASAVAGDTCLDEAYIRLENDAKYAGGQLIVGPASCTITVVPDVDDLRVTVVATTNTVTRSYESHVILDNNQTIVRSWRELE